MMTPGISGEATAGALPALYRRRWWILGLLFIATILNYLDRQSLSILASTIQQALGMSNIAYGHVVTAFLFSYTIAYALSGPFCDRVGIRWSMAILIAWWSMAELLPPFVHSAMGLGVARLLLGIGEAGIWLVGPKAVQQLFLPAQRGTAVGIYTAGATIGATIAPPLIAGLTLHHGWQAVFLVTGAAGLLWIVPWLLLFRDETQSGEAPLIHSGPSQPAAWHKLLRTRNLWLLLFARLLTDPVWFFYLFWYPKFLGSAGHLSLQRLGHTVWIIYLAADFGAIMGGVLSGRLIRRGWMPMKAGRAVMTGAACVFPFSVLIALLHSVPIMLGLAAVIAFAHMAWLICLTAAALDLFRQHELGTAFGFISAGSGLGGLISTELISHAIGTLGYVPIFAVMGALHPLALLLIWALRPAVASIGELQPALAPSPL
jgi:MFS transporter, ACS family, hexuronate transporter